MSLLAASFVCALCLWLLVTLLWLLSLKLRDTSIVDLFWGTGFVVVYWLSYALGPQAGLRPLLIGGLVTIWGLRLSIYLALRNLGHGEDFRYQKMRQAAGPPWWWRSYLMVFLLQGSLIWIISWPVQVVAHGPAALTLFDAAVGLLWAVGFFFEAVGDAQLRRFRRQPKPQGQVLQSGVWRYSRHPNYFGDATQWWAYYLFAALLGGAYTIFSPILMTFFLLRVSGVALLEKTLVEGKPAYKDYIRRTSAFVPWFPKT